VIAAKLAERVIEKFLHSPEAAQVVRQLDAQGNEQRREAVARIKAIRTAQEKAAPARRKALEDAVAAFVKSREAFEAAGQAVQRASIGQSDPSGDGEVARLERYLRDTAAPAIAECLASLEELAERVRSGPVERMATNFAGRRVVIGSTYEAQLEWLAKYTETRQAIEALMFEALDAAQLDARLAELRADLDGTEPLEMRPVRRG
jgi:sirohydrochlorin ferrochelatase